MKKLFLMASAAALIFASCSKDETSQNNSDKALLTVKIAGSTSSTRAIEAPGFDTDGNSLQSKATQTVKTARSPDST